MSRLALLHTTAVTLQPLTQLARQQLPQLQLVNLVDDSLLADVREAGAPTPAVEQRVAALVHCAELARADAVLSCCSSIGEVAEALARRSSRPIWRIDEALAAEAAASAGPVGLIATLATTLRPTERLIRRCAEQRGTPLELESLLVDGAFAALERGDGAEHDRLVSAALDALLARCRVLVLAQASMARLLEARALPAGVSVLTSPQSGLRLAAARLASLTGRGRRP